jgi:dephospho-CoA kinase
MLPWAMRTENMNKFYITGVSGTGKSALVKELEKRGIRAFDIDEVPELCHWKNKLTSEKAKYQSGIGQDWIEAHDWLCDKEKLKGLLDARGENTVIVAGIASNQDEYFDLFDKIFLLYCSEETFLHRLSTREENEFAREKSEQKQVLSWYKDFEDKMLKKGAIPINTEAPVNAVADQIILHIIPVGQ